MLYSIARICEILCQLSNQEKHICKLFNASSSEIYKGHGTYVISEDDTHKYHIHPYSIAKSMGHDIVKYYREYYRKHHIKINKYKKEYNKKYYGNHPELKDKMRDYKRKYYLKKKMEKNGTK